MMCGMKCISNFVFGLIFIISTLLPSQYHWNHAIQIKPHNDIICQQNALLDTVGRILVELYGFLCWHNKSILIRSQGTKKLRNLYAGQETTVRTEHGTTDWFQFGKWVDWFQFGKWVRQGCIVSTNLFDIYAEYFIRIAGLDEEQAGIKIARRNINNLRYADDTTLMEESEEI